MTWDEVEKEVKHKSTRNIFVFRLINLIRFYRARTRKEITLEGNEKSTQKGTKIRLFAQLSRDLLNFGYLINAVKFIDHTYIKSDKFITFTG